MPTRWNTCAAPGCEREREHPAAMCGACLREVYGYGGQIQIAKTLNEVPTRAAEPVADDVLRLQLQAIREDIANLQLAYHHHQKRLGPPDGIEFLDQVVGSVELVGEAPGWLHLQAQRTLWIQPRRVAITFRCAGARVEGRIGQVRIDNHPQIGVDDPTVRYGYLSSAAYDQPFGCPVLWGAFSWGVTPHSLQITVAAAPPIGPPIEVHATVWGVGRQEDLRDPWHETQPGGERWLP